MTRGRPATGSDAGVTLVETLIALVIMSTAIAGLVAGFGAAIRSGSIGRETAKAETVLRQYTEAVVRAPNGIETDGYRPCVSGAVPTYAPLTQDGYTASATSVEYWVDGSNPATYAGCANDASGVQKVTVQIARPDGTTTLVEIFMRKVT